MLENSGYFGNTIFHVGKMGYNAGINKVIVKLDPDYTKWGIFDLVEDVSHLQISGTVTSVGKSCNPKMSKLVNDFTRSYYRELPNPDVPIISPLKEGDRVVFSYLSKLEKDRFLSDELLIVDRGLIFGKGDPLIGINGFLLVEMSEKEKFENYGIFTVENDDVNDYGLGTNKEGAWGFRRQHAFRLELDLHNTLTTNQSSLFVVKREYAWALEK
jgi:hypothetical protein